MQRALDVIAGSLVLGVVTGARQFEDGEPALSDSEKTTILYFSGWLGRDLPAFDSALESVAPAVSMTPHDKNSLNGTLVLLAAMLGEARITEDEQMHDYAKRIVAFTEKEQPTLSKRPQGARDVRTIMAKFQKALQTRKS